MERKPQENRDLPFFARYLEGQDAESLRPSAGSCQIIGAATTKYPSDLDEMMTMKYPSDDDEGADDR